MTLPILESSMFFSVTVIGVTPLSHHTLYFFFFFQQFITRGMMADRSNYLVATVH